MSATKNINAEKIQGNLNITSVSATTISGTTFYGDGSNLTGISSEDNFVTGGTFTTNTLTLNRQNGSVTITGFTSDSNTFVTGFTYNDANTFTISDNNGSAFTASINILTGFTVNNGVGDGFVTINSTSGQELEINQRGVNFNYSTPNIQVGTTGANMMIGNTGGIGSYPSGSYPGLNLNTTTGDIFLFKGGYGGAGVVMDFQGGNIRDIHDIQSSFNWPLKLYGGPGPNDANDGIQMYTADNLNVYTKKFEIKADTGTPNAYFTNINNFGVNTITPQTTLDVNGTTRLLGLTANTLNLTTTPSNDNSQTQVLVRNNTTGLVEYRDASTFSGASGSNTFVTGTTFGSNQSLTRRNDGADVLILTGGTNVTLSNPSSNQIKIDVNIPAGMNTYVTGFTYNDNNTFTIFDNDGGSFPATFNQVSGLTVNGDITVTGTSNLNAVTATTVDFDLNYTGATDEGRLSWNSTDATLDLGMGGGNVTQQIGQEIYYRIKNQSGSTISNGRVVRNAGSVGASGRILGEYMIADGTYPFAKTLGIATEDILNGSDGLVTEFGVVRGLNTTGSLYGESWSDGDVLYVSSTIPGGLTNVEPQAPNQILEIGVVLFSNVGNGSIFVDRHLSTKLGDISDVQTTGATNGDLIVYNSATTVWDYSKTLTGDYDINGTLSATTLDGDTILSGGTNLITIIESLDTNTFVSGGTYNDTTNNINFSGNSTETTFDVDLTDLVSSVSGDTFVVGGTYVDSTNTIALLRNDGNFVNVTGVTNTYVTGGTVSVPATDSSNDGTIGLFYKDSDGTPRTLPFKDTFVTGTTFGSNQATLTRNDGTEIFKLSGGTENVVLSSPSTNQIKIDLDLGIKAGTVRGPQFTGNPKTYIVTFTTPYSSIFYSINITGESNRSYTFESKTSAGFVINTNANSSFTTFVDWTTIKHSEQ